MKHSIEHLSQFFFFLTIQHCWLVNIYFYTANAPLLLRLWGYQKTTLNVNQKMWNANSVSFISLMLKYRCSQKGELYLNLKMWLSVLFKCPIKWKQKWMPVCREMMTPSRHELSCIISDLRLYKVISYHWIRKINCREK